MNLFFKCGKNNDLLHVLKGMGYTYPRHNSLSQAIEQASEGGAVLCLADDYPRATEKVDEKLLNRAAAKRLRLYVEYPLAMAGVELGEPRPTLWERVVTTSDFFSPELARESIVALHGCWFLPTTAANPHLSLAKLAGYRKSAYGLPPETHPILFELHGREVLVATSKLSQFVTARYAPKADWKVIWEKILMWLDRSNQIPSLTWMPTVTIEADAKTPLPKRAEVEALSRSTQWFREQVVYSIDQKRGAIEGFESSIDYLGRQKRRIWVRGDCTAETGMVLAYDWARTKNPDSRQLAGQVFDYVWSSPDFRQDDPKSPVYGLNNWAERLPIFYGDDNARVILPTLTAGRLLENDRWDVHVLRCLLANLRTTGPQGFRESSLKYPHHFQDGKDWRYYRDHEFTHFAPHYQAYPWACYLWAYAMTGYEEFLKKSTIAIRLTMDKYPNWRWTNGITQEMARMLLPLAFLIRVEDTAEHRHWLDRIMTDLLAQMQPCGAIREMMGPIENGSYPSPRSNEAYGTNESSLIQDNGDPACDLLYTMNFAFLGLHEAAGAIGDKRIKDAEDRMADFFCRIQIRSAAQPYLDGAWMRGFDYDLWEYWASSSDLGWAAWCVESGWTNAWINSVLAMRQIGETLFDLSTAERFRKICPGLIQEMMT